MTDDFYFVFNNADLQALYTSLVEQGSASLVGALTAGATLEDKDIFDLESDMQLTENPAILTIFRRSIWYTIYVHRGGKHDS